MDVNAEKLKYLLNHMEFYIDELIDKVLSNYLTDPHYSAVAATNKIKCYIQIMNELGEKLPYTNEREFFEFNAYTNEEYKALERSKENESKYYRGVQY